MTLRIAKETRFRRVMDFSGHNGSTRETQLLLLPHFLHAMQWFPFSVNSAAHALSTTVCKDKSATTSTCLAKLSTISAKDNFFGLLGDTMLLSNAYILLPIKVSIVGTFFASNSNTLTWNISTHLT